MPGQNLFQYLDDAGECRVLTSDMVNEYLQRVCGSEFSAKDFRTWGATLAALRLLRTTPRPDPLSDRACARCVNEVVRTVAASLGNSPVICRKSYINPTIFDAWRAGDLQAPRFRNLGAQGPHAEAAALRLGAMPIPEHPRIRHLGFLDDTDKFDAMAAADLLIMPSYFESRGARSA